MPSSDSCYFLLPSVTNGNSRRGAAFPSSTRATTPQGRSAVLRAAAKIALILNQAAASEACELRLRDRARQRIATDRDRLSLVARCRGGDGRAARLTDRELRQHEALRDYRDFAQLVGLEHHPSFAVAIDRGGVAILQRGSRPFAALGARGGQSVSLGGAVHRRRLHGELSRTETRSSGGVDRRWR